MCPDDRNISVRSLSLAIVAFGFEPDATCIAGRYGRTIDYRQPPDPPLSPEDAAWAEELPKATGKR